jgi:hypothetical protein
MLKEKPSSLFMLLGMELNLYCLPDDALSNGQIRHSNETTINEQHQHVSLYQPDKSAMAKLTASSFRTPGSWPQKPDEQNASLGRQQRSSSIPIT